MRYLCKNSQKRGSIATTVVKPVGCAEKFMIWKKFCVLTLILGFIFSLMLIGCGDDDDDKVDDKVGDTSYLGSWEIVTINGATFEEAFTADDQEGLEQSVELISNDWVFNADGTWSWHFEFKTTSDFHEPVYSIKSHQDYNINGMYTAEGSTLTLTEDDVELNAEVTLDDPEEYLESQGLSKEALETQAKEDLEKSVSETLFKGETDCTWDVQDNVLTLKGSDLDIVLKKK